MWLRLSPSSRTSSWPAGSGVAAFGVGGVGVHRLEDAGHRLLLQPLARVALVHTGLARQLGGRRRARVRECPVQPEPVAQVDAEKIHRPQRAAEEPLDQLVTTCVGGTCGRHAAPRSRIVGRQASQLRRGASTNAAPRIAHRLHDLRHATATLSVAVGESVLSCSRCSGIPTCARRCGTPIRTTKPIAQRPLALQRSEKRHQERTTRLLSRT